MKLQSTCYSLIGLVGLLCLQAGLPSQAAADEIGKDCHPAPPLRFKSNKQLSNKLLKGKAFFTKNLSADAVFKSFEILPYQDYQEKYGDIGTRCDTSLNRMVAVLVVDYPKGLFSRVVYSKATATSVYDGQIGESLMFSTTGDMIAGGPSFLWDLHQQPKDNFSTTTPKSQLKNSTVDSGVKAIGSPATIYKSTEQMFGDADLVVVGKFSNEKIIVQPSQASRIELGHLDSEFSVTEVIKGKADSKLYVAQNGVIGATMAESKPMEGDRFFKAGDSYILFLKKPLPHEVKEAGDRNFYYLVGGYQGGYRVKNGKVYSRDIEELDLSKLSKAPPNPAYGHRVNRVELSAFVKYLKEIILSI
jgi:hypothetical protein